MGIALITLSIKTIVYFSVVYIKFIRFEKMLKFNIKKEYAHKSFELSNETEYIKSFVLYEYNGRNINIILTISNKQNNKLLYLDILL